MNEKKSPQKKPLPNTKRKPPASLFLWLLAFLVLASLIVFNSSPYFSAQEEWSANAFLSQLDKGAVVSAEIMPESDKILAISGEFKMLPKPADAKATQGASSDATKTDGSAAPAIVEKDLTKPSGTQNAENQTVTPVTNDDPFDQPDKRTWCGYCKTMMRYSEFIGGRYICDNCGNFVEV